MDDVLEAVRPEISEARPLGKGTLHEPAGGLREEHLAPMCRSSYAGRSIHVDPHVVVAPKNPLPGVNTYPNADVRGLRPVVTGKASLGCHRRQDGVHRSTERNEEGITLGVDLDSPELGDCTPNDPRVFVKDDQESFPELLDEPRGALDIGE